MSNWDGSWREPANQIGCTDCHDAGNATPNAGTGPAGYPEHPDPAGRGANPFMLKGGAASWDGRYASNRFCLKVCHEGATPSTARYRMGHYGWGGYDNAAPSGTLKDPGGKALKSSRCTDCHESHGAPDRKSLFVDRVDAANCTNLCHDGAPFFAVGHGRGVSTSGQPMGLECSRCHDASVPHRNRSNPRRLGMPEAGRKATLAENLASNGLDDDYDGVVDNPGEAAFRRSGESNCTTASCHPDRKLHAGTGGHNGSPGSASCLHCHDVHGNGVDNNIRMIRSKIMGMTVRYREKTDYFRSDYGATVASLCDNPRCHSGKRLGNVSTPGTILADVPEHVEANVGPGYDCSECHPHQGPASFIPSCTRCHGYPGQSPASGSHALSSVHDRHVDPSTGYGYECSTCHFEVPHNVSRVRRGSEWESKFKSANARVRFDGRINPRNANGPAYGGAAADNGSAGAPGVGDNGAAQGAGGACQGLYCHANSASARAWSGNAGAPSWFDNASGACGTCHKVTGATLASGAHRKHVDNGAVGYGIGCQTCHYATTGDGLTVTGRAAHVNPADPAARVSWNPDDNAVKDGRPYSRAKRQCVNIYCHSSGTRTNGTTYDNGAYGWPTWGQAGTIGCNRCHGDGSRNDGTPAYPNGTPKVNSHRKHMESGNGCQMCHSATTKDGRTIADRTRHADAKYDVSPDNATHAFGTPYESPSCAVIACHGLKNSAWGGAPIDCGGCHLGSVDTDQYMTNNASWYASGVPGTIDNVEWEYSGHGRTPFLGNYDLTGNPPADLATRAGGADPCLFCHDAVVPHRVGLNPFRLKRQTGVSGYGDSGWNATCLVCHSRSQTPPGYQPTGGAPYRTTVAAAGHRVDTSHFGAKHSSIDNSGGGYFCWDCHDPHGDRPNARGGNIAMIQRWVLPKHDGQYGARIGAVIGENAVLLTFEKDNTIAEGGDWGRADFRGLCQVCHHGSGRGSYNQAKYYTPSSDNTGHNGAADCLSCHTHDINFGSSCTTCHGDGATRIWPQNPGPGPSTKNAVTAYNYAGAHTLHLSEIAARIGGFNLADNGTWNQSQQTVLCLYCHDYKADPRHGAVGGRAVVFPATGRRMMGGASDNGAPTFVPTDNGCTNVQCHNRKGTTSTWNWYTGAAKRCDMCHATVGAVADNNPRSGLHNANVATRHDNTLPVGLGGAGGCRSCHWNAGLPVQSTTQRHINGVSDNAATTLDRPGMVYLDSPSANRGSCGGPGLDNAAGIGCHRDRGAWRRLWSTEADNTATAVGSPRCNVCHGQWYSISGSAGWRDNTSHFNADGSVASLRGKTHEPNPESCTQCHPYDGKTGHENGLVAINDNGTLASDNAASRRAGCSQCHPGVDYANGSQPDQKHTYPIAALPMQKVRGEAVVASCTTCHGGLTGDPAQVRSNAPNITKYWLSTGHGKYSTSLPLPVAPVQCADCHDTAWLNPADHKANGLPSGTYPPTNINTLMWPGKRGTTDTSPTVNTAHLRSSYFPAFARNKSDYARAFDTKCGARGVGCHLYPTPPSHVGRIHPDSRVPPFDNALTFGRQHGGTTPDPKAYPWYPVVSSADDYANRFYESPTVWLVQDITTLANNAAFPDNAVSYGVCVSCHDPHGTGSPVKPGERSNYMLRGEYNRPVTFCQPVCHGN
jgi:predicted CxxxxCH...CXXCH cytochrome family protein